jgi:hypothetical protein
VRTDPTEPNLPTLVGYSTLDAELAALVWLLLEDGVPLVVSGDTELAGRRSLAGALLGTPPSTAWSLIDADDVPPDAESIGDLLRQGTRLGITLRARSLQGVIERLAAPPHGLPEDAVRRLGVVLIASNAGEAPRVTAAHYLRPIERDAAGHVQRRPPAVLATWDPDRGFEHFAWGVTPELADRVNRSQADLERRQAARARLLDDLASAPEEPARTLKALRDHLDSEPPREPRQQLPTPREGIRSPLTDPHLH